MTVTAEPLQRRHDLDWLRILAFALLIFYHIGMLYVENWGFHIKSQYQSEFLENIMLLVNRWRLPILFLISGLAIRYILEKISIIQFINKRSLRLLLPLAFGVLVIVPPQLYLEMSQNGDMPLNYWEFYKAFFVLDHPLSEQYQAGILPHMDVNHLWYIRELWAFSIYLICLLPLLNSSPIQTQINWVAKYGKGIGLITIPVLLLSILNLTVFPDGEGHRKALGFTFLVIGYLIGWHTSLWEQIKRTRRIAPGIALCSYIVIVAYYNFFYLKGITEFELAWEILKEVISALNIWCWILAILAYGTYYLNQPSKTLQYLNEAVYPYYILHQTIIIMTAFALSKHSIGPILEPIAVILITFTGCALAFELIRRSSLLRVLFGLNCIDTTLFEHLSGRKYLYYTSIAFLFILLTPLGLLILF